MRRIALVDDSFETRHMMRMLVGIRYDVYAYETGEELLRAMDSQKFDLILLDIILPGGRSGIELGAAIRAMYPLDALPIIALSGDTRAETREAASRAGINLYLTKPITDFETFLGVIDSFLKPSSAA